MNVKVSHGAVAAIFVLAAAPAPARHSPGVSAPTPGGER